MQRGIITGDIIYNILYILLLYLFYTIEGISNWKRRFGDSFYWFISVLVTSVKDSKGLPSGWMVANGDEVDGDVDDGTTRDAVNNGTSSDVDGDPSRCCCCWLMLLMSLLDMRVGCWWLSAMRKQSMDFPLSCRSWWDADWWCVDSEAMWCSYWRSWWRPMRT